MSAVIYVYNAENRIEEFLKAVIHSMEKNFEHSEIICVNDCSNDRSVEIIKDIAKSAKSTSISVLNLSYFHGLEMSMNAGIDLSIGDFVMEFDNTVLDFDEEVIMKIYYRSLEGYDVVSASANRRQKLSSKFYYKALGTFTDVFSEMQTESFRVLSRRVINRISSMNKTVPYRKIVYANCGLKTDNIVYDIRKNYKAKKIKGKKENKYKRNLAVDTLILFTEVGYSFSIIMTLLMMISTIAIAAYSIVTYITSNPVEGWTTTILFFAFSFFGLFGLLTIVIKYLQIIVDLVFKRKRYSFESIEKLTK